MELPRSVTVPSLDPVGVARVRRLCDAIVQTSQVGLDAAMLVEALNDTTANEFTLADVVEGAQTLGSEVFASLAISPPTPCVDAPLEVWAELVRRIRSHEGTRFEWAWWLELLAQATARDDVAARVLEPGAATPEAIANALFRAPPPA
jgi:hypothetical protein